MAELAKTPQDGAIRRSLVVGLGKTGLSCARYLASLGREVAVVDSRTNPPGLDVLREQCPDLPLFLGGFSEEAFAAADQIVLSPGVSLKEPAVAAAIARGVPVVGDVELFARQVTAPIIAVTGSNGKSTVATLVGAMAQFARRDVRVGGNLGTPALELMFLSEPDLYVLERSSFQLETTRSLAPAAAVVLNISPDHMDRYSDLEEYAAAKARVFDNAAVKVANRDDPLVDAMAKGGGVVGFTLGEPGGDDYGLRESNGRLWLAQGQRLLMPADEVLMPGRHNLANALAALALGEAVGLPLDAMQSVLRIFPGLPHRSQWVGEQDGVTWYNDSKGTNVGATLAALGGMPGQVVLIAGGLGKGADFSPLRPVVAEKARAVVLIGQDAGLIEESLKGTVPMVRVGSMDEAVVHAQQLARPGDSVLLSPACASFDMFSGFEARGEAFMAAVRRLLS